MINPKKIYAVNMRKLYPGDDYLNCYVEVFTHEKYLKTNLYPEPIAKELWEDVKLLVGKCLPKQLDYMFK